MSTNDLTPAELEAVARLCLACRELRWNDAYADVHDPLVDSAWTKIREMKEQTQ